MVCALSDALLYKPLLNVFAKELSALIECGLGVSVFVVYPFTKCIPFSYKKYHPFVPAFCIRLIAGTIQTFPISHIICVNFNLHAKFGNDPLKND